MPIEIRKRPFYVLAVAAAVCWATTTRLPAEVNPPAGFTSLFNGKDLDGWHGQPHFDRRKLDDMTPAEREKTLAGWMQQMREHWTVDNGEIVNDGHGAYLTTNREFGDIELLIEYKTVAKADSGIYLRGTPQVQIWDYTKAGGKWNINADKGSGGLYNNAKGAAGQMPLVLADKPFGEWNAFRILQVGDRTSVWLNDKLVVDHAPMANFWDRSRPLFANGRIQLQTHGGEIRWRNLFVREIPTAEATRILEQHIGNGFVPVFNGKDFTGWAGDVENYEVVDGVIRCKAGKGGNLFTKEEYADFVVRMEFKLPPGGNNGLAIRYPGEGRPYVAGMCELQVLDSEHEKYAKLDPRQYHGSAYGMVPAHRGYLRPTGEWNFQQVTVQGSTIKVELNGYTILDADLSKVTEFKDNTPHPGKDRTQGHFGFAGHNDPVEFRNIRIKTLPKQAALDKPNFIVVFCDNLGYGDIEPFGSTVNRTPHLNRMAREGRRFTHFCVTAGVCTPSRSSIMTGCYSQRVGMHDNPRDGQVLRPISPYGLNPDEVTIAEVLKQQGYVTSIIGKWHLGDQPAFLPTRQGFDHFFGIPYSDDMTYKTGQRLGERLNGANWPPLPLMENETVVEAPVDRDYLTKRYTERALEFLETNRDKPFFLYFPQAMPGSTREPFSSPAFKGKSANGPWGDSVEELDWSTGQLLDKLVELGIDDRTLVVWTSDNGAPMSADMKSTARGTNKPLFGRGYTTSEGAFRAPTIMWQPGTVPAQTVCDELATTMDLLPTFAQMAGGSAPADRKIDGHDIAPLIVGADDAKSPYEAFYYYQMDQLQAVRSGPWKLFLPLKSFVRHPHFRAGEATTPLLFNVTNDVASTTNVADKHPDVVERLMALAEKARADLGDVGRAGKGQRKPGRVDNPQPQVQAGG